jgi:copper homeostasis protein
MKRKVLEICAQNIQSVLVAQEGGADRVELCSGLELGGLSPSFAFVELALQRFQGKVFVLLRPRPGHFVYSVDEVDIICRDAAVLAEMGAHGIVFGALNDKYELDLQALAKVRNAAPDLEFTFHRALDVASKPESLIESLIELQIPRVLTSGAASSAIEAHERLSKWVTNYGNEIKVLVGGGVRSSNLERLLETGAQEFHLSAQVQIDAEKYGDLIPGDYKSSAIEEIVRCRAILNEHT